MSSIGNGMAYYKHFLFLTYRCRFYFEVYPTRLRTRHMYYRTRMKYVFHRYKWLRYFFEHLQKNKRDRIGHYLNHHGTIKTENKANYLCDLI